MGKALPGAKRRFRHISIKEVLLMPITLTFHVFGLTITVTVKSRNRHSAK